jgi:hypothetical protein
MLCVIQKRIKIKGNGCVLPICHALLRSTSGVTFVTVPSCPNCLKLWITRCCQHTNILKSVNYKLLYFVLIAAGSKSMLQPHMYRILRIVFTFTAPDTHAWKWPFNTCNFIHAVPFSYSCLLITLKRTSSTGVLLFIFSWERNCTSDVLRQ